MTSRLIQSRNGSGVGLDSSPRWDAFAKIPNPCWRFSRGRRRRPGDADLSAHRRASCRDARPRRSRQRDQPAPPRRPSHGRQGPPLAASVLKAGRRLGWRGPGFLLRPVVLLQLFASVFDCFRGFFFAVFFVQRPCSMMTLARATVLTCTGTFSASARILSSLARVPGDCHALQTRNFVHLWLDCLRQCCRLADVLVDSSHRLSQPARLCRCHRSNPSALWPLMDRAPAVGLSAAWSWVCHWRGASPGLATTPRLRVR